MRTIIDLITIRLRISLTWRKSKLTQRKRSRRKRKRKKRKKNKKSTTPRAKKIKKIKKTAISSRKLLAEAILNVVRLLSLTSARTQHINCVLTHLSMHLFYISRLRWLFDLCIDAVTEFIRLWVRHLCQLIINQEDNELSSSEMKDDEISSLSEIINNEDNVSSSSKMKDDEIPLLLV